MPHMVRTIARPPAAISAAAMISTVQRAPDEAMPVPVLADAVPAVARSTARPTAQMAGTEGRGTWARIVTSGAVAACNSSLEKAPCRIWRNAATSWCLAGAQRGSRPRSPPHARGHPSPWSRQPIRWVACAAPLRAMAAGSTWAGTSRSSTTRHGWRGPNRSWTAPCCGSIVQWRACSTAASRQAATSIRYPRPPMIWWPTTAPRQANWARTWVRHSATTSSARTWRRWTAGRSRSSRPTAHASCATSSKRPPASGTPRAASAR